MLVVLHANTARCVNDATVAAASTCSLLARHFTKQDPPGAWAIATLKWWPCDAS